LPQQASLTWVRFARVFPVCGPAGAAAQRLQPRITAYSGRAQLSGIEPRAEIRKLGVLRPWAAGPAQARGRAPCRRGYPQMKKLKNEKELVKKAIAAGMKYGEERGVVEFEPTDSQTEKIEYIYRLLVHDKIIQPVPQEQISQLAMKHRIAIWASKLK
jgi:hypothetical protein